MHRIMSEDSKRQWTHRTNRILRRILGDGDQREFDLETRVTTNGNLIIPKMFHSCALNK